jgi:hypothetical protein
MCQIVNSLMLSFQPFSMESLNKAMAEAKKQRPIKDLLMEQIAKLRGSDGPDDESFKESIYELVQILLATVAFIFLVICLLCFFFYAALF